MQQISGRHVYTVSEVNRLARVSLEQLSFWVQAEIFSIKGTNTNYRYIYFDLKDSTTGFRISCIMEPEDFAASEVPLTDGDSVLALGNLTLFERDGRFQMYVHKLEPFGTGVLLEQIEKLKRKLQDKGYFALARKQTIKPFPTKIALIASQNSDAMHDFIKHSKLLYPILTIKLFDVLTQGIYSSEQVATAIRRADASDFDVIAIVRGGGSSEDLASFNDEKLADAIFTAKTPIVVGVGHEKDVTIAQLVADISASTPTDAAKIITKDYSQVLELLDRNLGRLIRASSFVLDSSASGLDTLYVKLLSKRDKFSQLPLRLTIARNVLENAKQLHIRRNKDQLQILFEKLNLLSPEKVLKRGYSITTDEKGRVIRDAALVAIGANIRVKFEKGKVGAKILTKS